MKRRTFLAHAGALAGTDRQFPHADHMIPTYRVFAIQQGNEAMGHGRKAEVECDQRVSG